MKQFFTRAIAVLTIDMPAEIPRESPHARRLVLDALCREEITDAVITLFRGRLTAIRRCEGFGSDPFVNGSEEAHATILNELQQKRGLLVS